MRLPFHKDKELRSALYHIFGFYPHRIHYYKLALMHKSVTKRIEKGKPLNNERLEFLGDAILDAIVGDIVYRHFEGKREGFLTSTRSKIVQRDTLNRLATEMGITQLIKAGKHTPSHNSYLGGNAFEALVGAMYLDRGYEACMRFMEKRILAQLINIDKVAYKEINFKSKLIEWCQKNKVLLDFKLIEQKKEGKNSPVFKYQVINKMNIRKVEHLLEALEPHPTKLLMTGDPSDMLKAEQELLDVVGDKMDVFRSAPFFLELVPKGIDKAQSLRRLLAKINLTPADMIAFGDGYNDLSMLKLAGMGVAMANAAPEVRADADYITLSNEEDGVAAALEHFGM